MIIDAHAHIMSKVYGQTGSGPTRSLPLGKVRMGDQVIRLLPPASLAETAFPPQVLLEHMDWAGVDKAVLLQGPFYGVSNEYVYQAAKRWPDRFIGVGSFDPCAPDARETFRRITDEFGFHSLKFEMSENAGLTGLHPDLRLDGERMAWIWEEAESRGLAVTLDLGAVGSRPYETRAVRHIIVRHPGLKIVIAHLAVPPVANRDDDHLDWLWQDMVRLGRHPNVWFDLAALPALAGAEGYPYPTVQEYIRRAVEMVGVEKMIWGTDVPGLLCHATYLQLLDFCRHCDFFSESDLARVLGGNAWRVYGDPEKVISQEI